MVYGFCSPRVVGLLAGSFVFGVLLVWYFVRGFLTGPPSPTGDEPHFDSIGWELSEGRGFTLEFSDEEFRRPYERQYGAESTAEVLPPRESVPDTTRSPLFPVLIAGTNVLCGRQFFVIRLCQMFALAVVVGCVAGGVVQRFSLSAGVITTLVILTCDVRVRLYGRTLLSEPLAAVLVTGMVFCLWRYARRADAWSAAGVGVCFGLGILTRSALLTWLPGVCCLLLALGWKSRGLRPTLRHLVTLAAVVLAVYTPWAVRNCAVTGRFTPLGLQGQVQLAAGYSEYAWQARGLWVNLDAESFFDSLPLSEVSYTEGRLLKAEQSRSHALDWIRDHPVRTLALFPMKVWQTFRPRSVLEGLLLFASIAGLLLLRDRREQLLFGGLYAAAAFGVGVTWSVGGRFLVPLLFVQHLLIGQLIGTLVTGRQVRADAHSA